jgi:hypothetical protein
MSAALVAIALAAALPCRAERPNIQLQVEPCLRIPAEQIWGPLAVEFRGMVSAVGQELAGRMKVRVSCEPSGRARVEVSDPATRRVLSRSVELGAWGERSRPRLLAIAVAELVAESRSEPPPQPVRPPASPPETPPEPADTAPAIAPARLALPPSAERAMALGAFAVGRKIGRGPLELGAAIRFTWDAPGQIGILAELGWERGSTGTPLGKVVGDTVGAAVAATFRPPWNPLGLRLGAGLRAGSARLSGREIAGVSVAGTVSGAWGGPLALAEVVWDAGRWTADFGAEAGLDLSPVRGLVDGGREVDLAGPWLAFRVGAAVRF